MKSKMETKGHFKEHEMFNHYYERREIKPGLRRKSVVFGLLVIGFGICWLLRNLGLLDPQVEEGVFSWQALVIAIGIINLANGHGRFFGALLVVTGGFFMITKFNGMPSSFQDAFWPSLIILIGLTMLFKSRRIFRRKPGIITANDDYVEEIAVFGGRERRVVSSSFKGGNIISVFGGSVLDLSKCQLAEGPQEIEFVSVFGGSKIMVPRDWNVKTEIVSVLGGFSDKRNLDEVAENKVLKIKGVAIFGGGELLN
jgi:predicted membrane protein